MLFIFAEKNYRDFSCLENVLKKFLAFLALFSLEKKIFLCFT